MGVVVVAAGSGSRLGADRPKAFVELAGRPLLEHALAGVLASEPDEIVVVAPAGWEDTARAMLVSGADTDRPLQRTVVTGGSERTDSVSAGLAALTDRVDVVLVHDAARCLTPSTVYSRVVDAVLAGADGAVPGLPVVDTIKVVDDASVVVDTPARSSLRAVQTPQGFRADLLRAAHATGVQATDDAALVESLGYQVVVVEGHPHAMKVTTVPDLAMAEQIVASGLVR